MVRKAVLNREEMFTTTPRLWLACTDIRRFCEPPSRLERSERAHMVAVRADGNPRPRLALVRAEVEGHMAPERQPGITGFRLAQLERELEALTKKVDRMTWALVTLTLSLAGSAIVFALTVVAVRKQ